MTRRLLLKRSCKVRITVRTPKGNERLPQKRQKKNQEKKSRNTFRKPPLRLNGSRCGLPFVVTDNDYGNIYKWLIMTPHFSPSKISRGPFSPCRSRGDSLRVQEFFVTSCACHFPPFSTGVRWAKLIKEIFPWMGVSLNDYHYYRKSQVRLPEVSFKFAIHADVSRWRKCWLTVNLL